MIVRNAALNSTGVCLILMLLLFSVGLHLLSLYVAHGNDLGVVLTFNSDRQQLCFYHRGQFFFCCCADMLL